MVEYWNNGMVGIEDQNEYNDIDFLIIVAHFIGQEQKMDAIQVSS
jgi:hypothetical protein